MSQTIPHWLTKQADLAPGKTAIELDNGTTITFKELKEKSQQFAKKLARMDITQGERVGILSANHTDVVITLHALSYLGAVAVMLNTRLTDKELDYQINDAGISLVLAQKTDRNLNTSVQLFSTVWELEEKPTELRSEINLDDLFTIIYTSGTTGFPKGVMHTYGNHWWSAIGSMLNLGLHRHDKWMAALPLFHVGGLSILIRSVIYGMPIYLVEKYDKQLMHDAIMSKGVTIVSVVTVMLNDLIELLGSNRYPDSLRCMLLGGGPAPKSILEAAKKRHMPVFQSYGMTETASQIVSLSPDDALNKIGSSGKALFPAQLQIDTSDSEIGEIFVKGPMVTQGYLNNETKTSQTITNGWLATGDLGYLDEEGFLFVVDRRKDLIISGGENIYPTEIESILSSMDAIYEAGVVGKRDAKWGQVPVAFVVKQKEITVDAIIKDMKGSLARYKIPREIFFLNQLPRNASNKIVRSELSKYLDE